LLEQGETINSILPMIFLFFRRMWIVHELKMSGKSESQILKELGGSSYYYKDIFNSLDNFTKEKFFYIFEQLELSEIQLKTSQKHEESILTMLIYNICKF